MVKEWIKVVKGSQTPDERRRAEICSVCPHRTKAKFLQFIKSEIEEVQGHYCSKCGCPLVAKIKTEDQKHICQKWK